MTKKEKFITEIEEALNKSLVLSSEAQNYFDELKGGKASTGAFTENGIKILQFMQENKTKYFKSILQLLRFFL